MNCFTFSVSVINRLIFIIGLIVLLVDISRGRYRVLKTGIEFGLVVGEKGEVGFLFFRINEHKYHTSRLVRLREPEFSLQPALL